MALINCPECEKQEISVTEGAICPSCGFKVNKDLIYKIEAKAITQKGWFIRFLFAQIGWLFLVSLFIGISNAKGGQLFILSFLAFIPLIVILFTNKYINNRIKYSFIGINIFFMIIIPFL